MEYRVKRIEGTKEIHTCARFEVRHFQWVDGPKPETYGYMGYLEGQGLYVQMYCRESSPRRECSEPNGKYETTLGRRVCDDSAMEIFIGFPGEDGKITNDSLYLNFEINANGVMFACYGRGKKERSFLPEKVYERACPGAEIQEEGIWTAHVLFPKEFLQDISGVDVSRPGTEFYCNFYKISETAEIEHYGSFARVESEHPDFHLPESFSRAVVE